MKKLRLILWILVPVTFSILLGAVAVYLKSQDKAGASENIVAVSKPVQLAVNNDAEVKIGGKFNLVDQNGVEVTEDNFKDIYTVVFFGFTNCPDVCPTGLSQISLSLKALGEHEKRFCQCS
jgi:cytochrome oxidase Cu insertion factor (SCO1/SenC/PrrC family)